MVQVVKDYCDNELCEKEMVGKRRVVVRQEYSSRSSYYREYCSTDCMVEDAQVFENYTSRRDLHA